MWQNLQAVGIDLGTTYSLIAGVQDSGEVSKFNTLSDSIFLPSTVTFGDEDAYVGYPADKAGYASFKRLMNKPHESIDASGVTPFQLSELVLRALREHAERYTGKAIQQAVITVPAYFDDTARQATRQAAFRAGWRVLRLINEPTAAAYAYGLEEQIEHGLYMMYDWGGGTFDVSILELTSGVFQVKSTCGDIALGGDDVDEAIMSAYGLSRAEARQIKEKGSVEGLQKITVHLMERTLKLCSQALRDAHVTPDQLMGIVLVGGSSRLSFVKEQLQGTFGCRIWDHLNPDTLVVQGAARQAHALTHPSDDALLLDVNPLSLGVETAGGLVDVIIPRNTLLPATHYQDFTTGADHQKAIYLHVVQGESLLTSECRSLAKFELGDLPMRPAGKPRIRVTFEVDVDGLLSVHATDLETQAYKAIHVHPTYGLNEKDWVQLTQGQDDRRHIEAIAEVKQTIQYIQQALQQDGDTLAPEEFVALRQATDMLECDKDDLELDALLERHAALSRMAQPLAEKRMAKHMLHQSIDSWKE